MDEIEKMLLLQVADLHKIPEGAYNIRKDGAGEGRRSTANIEIAERSDGNPGIDIIVKPGTKRESVHIPVVITRSGLQDTVYNDFYIGEDADVLIIAGCGIHNCGKQQSEHSGVHTFHIGRNARVRYVEKHYGEGDGNGENVMNPTTKILMEEGAQMEMETTQIKGIDSTERVTRAELKAGATLVIREKIYTHGKQFAKTDFSVDLNGDGSSADVVSRSVAAQTSYQEFIFGEDGVLRHWLRHGIGGYRLDVADELPDFFLQKLRKAVKEEDPDAVIIGEVWEDASNKIAYSQRRKYLQGYELSCRVHSYGFHAGKL